MGPWEAQPWVVVTDVDSKDDLNQNSEMNNMEDDRDSWQGLQDEEEIKTMSGTSCDQVIYNQHNQQQYSKTQDNRQPYASRQPILYTTVQSLPRYWGSEPETQANLSNDA